MPIHAIPSGLTGDALIDAVNDRFRRVPATAQVAAAVTPSRPSGGGGGTTPAPLPTITFADITGQVTLDQLKQIAGNLDIGNLTGQFNAPQLAQIFGGVNVQNFIGSWMSENIGSVIGGIQIGSFGGNFSVDQINQLESGLQIGNFGGNFSVGQIGQMTAINIGSFQGVLVSTQVADGLINSLKMLATTFAVPKRVSGLPPISADYPPGALVLNTADTPPKLYQNVGGTWTLVTASSKITGQITSGDVVSIDAGTINGIIQGPNVTINAGIINGQISAGVVDYLSISQFQGNLDVSRVNNIGSLTIASFQGNLDASRVANITSIAIASFQGNLDASRVANITNISVASFQGNLDASRVNNITSINIGTFTGQLNISSQVGDATITSAKIASLNIGKLNGIGGESIQIGTGCSFVGGWGVVTIGGSFGINAGNLTISANLLLGNTLQCGILTVTGTGTPITVNNHLGTGFAGGAPSETVRTSSGLDRPIRAGIICQS